VVNWGSVPDWVGGVGTAGALLLGFYILLRDRRNEEARQAKQVGYRFQWAFEDGESVGRLVVRNASSLPIYDIHLRYDFRPWRPTRLDPVRARELDVMARRIYAKGASWSLGTGSGTVDEIKKREAMNVLRWSLLWGPRVNQDLGEPIAILGPDESATVAGRRFFPMDLYQFSMDFRDSRNQHWERTLDTGDLRRYRSRETLRFRDLLGIVFRRVRWRRKTRSWRTFKRE